MGTTLPWLLLRNRERLIIALDESNFQYNSFWDVVYNVIVFFPEDNKMTNDRVSITILTTNLFG